MSDEVVEVDLNGIQLADLLNNYDHPAWPKVIEAYRDLEMTALAEWEAESQGIGGRAERKNDKCNL